MINSKQLQANIEVQKIALAKAQSDYNRRVPLGNANLIGREELQHARDAVTSAQAQLDVAIQQYNANQAMILGLNWKISLPYNRLPPKYVTPGWRWSVPVLSVR